MSVLHFVIPAGVDDPAAPSGGNRYDRRLCDELSFFAIASLDEEKRLHQPPFDVQG